MGVGGGAQRREPGADRQALASTGPGTLPPSDEPPSTRRAAPSTRHPALPSSRTAPSTGHPASSAHVYVYSARHVALYT